LRPFDGFNILNPFTKFPTFAYMQLSEIIEPIISAPLLHAKWLNTLSMMENTGARKISASESKSKVTLMVLKHAAEEARHAYYLKKQIAKIDSALCEDYSFANLLAPAKSFFYLHQLDIEISRYLKTEMGLGGESLKYGAYLLVTYAIEVRADELYPVYQDALTKAQSNINVKSIITEEEGHLAEMLHQMNGFFEEWEIHAREALKYEKALYEEWIKALAKEIILIKQRAGI